MDLALTNPATDSAAEFVITNPETFIASVIDVGPGASQVVTVGGLSDGSVIVPVQFNGNDASVSSLIACDAPICAQGVLTTVVDDSGVQHEACVESAADVPPVAAPVKASLAPQPTPTTGPSTGAAKLPANWNRHRWIDHRLLAGRQRIHRLAAQPTQVLIDARSLTWRKGFRRPHVSP